jgi:hypothetical protein
MCAGRQELGSHICLITAARQMHTFAYVPVHPQLVVYAFACLVNDVQHMDHMDLLNCSCAHPHVLPCCVCHTAGDWAGA